MAQAFVTGGSGFIGRLLVRRLVVEGHLVRVLFRSEASAELVAALRAEPVHDGLTHPATRRNRVRGSEVLLDLAAERISPPCVRAISAPRPPAHGRPSMRLARPELLSPSTAQARRHYLRVTAHRRRRNRTLRPDSAAHRAASVIPVPAPRFLGQACTLRIDKAVTELGYEPVVSPPAGLDAT